MDASTKMELKMITSLASLLGDIDTRLAILIYQDQYYHHDLTVDEFTGKILELQDTNTKQAELFKNIMAGLEEK